jgi:hypothetical protein
MRETIKSMYYDDEEAKNATGDHNRQDAKNAKDL